MPAFVASTTTLNVDAMISLPTAMTAITRTPPSAAPTERSSLDDFFGYTVSSFRTYEIRHDSSNSDALPPYVEDLPPTYSLKAPEPVTLAKYLFKFGFLFPPFWVLGAWILWSPLRAPSSDADSEGGWMANKTESERQRVLADVRKAEVRWALYCLWSFVIFSLLAIIGGTTWAILRS
ncbi:hypothetical protein H0H92_011185 [Tricholoma furcatifolium]|nr:hypothetical protein H0H92_011185 [Tricholoma furcatifolium]